MYSILILAVRLVILWQVTSWEIRVLASGLGNCQHRNNDKNLNDSRRVLVRLCSDTNKSFLQGNVIALVHATRPILIGPRISHIYSSSGKCHLASQLLGPWILRINKSFRIRFSTQTSQRLSPQVQSVRNHNAVWRSCCSALLSRPISCAICHL